MDELLNELDLRILKAKVEIKTTTEKVHAYETLLAFQEEVLSDLETTRRVVLDINSEPPTQLGVDRDH